MEFFCSLAVSGAGESLMELLCSLAASGTGESLMELLCSLAVSGAVKVLIERLWILPTPMLEPLQYGRCVPSVHFSTRWKCPADCQHHLPVYI
jgi:hypothetical protein